MDVGQEAELENLLSFLPELYFYVSVETVTHILLA